MMHYTYILQSKDGNLYTSYTSDLKKRLEQHNEGAVISTKQRLPLKLIYYEACISRSDATHREKYLKTAWGKRYLKTRLQHYLTGKGDSIR